MGIKVVNGVTIVTNFANYLGSEFGDKDILFRVDAPSLEKHFQVGFKQGYEGSLPCSCQDNFLCFP